MDVAVCGAAKAFMRGGAEQMQEALVEAFRAAGHRAELVRLPVAWERGRLFDAPLAWRLAPVDADLVVATNFPSYFVRHPNKVVWLLHQHRGAYDAAGAEWSDFAADEDSFETQRLLAEWDGRALGEARRLFTLSETVSIRLRNTLGLVGEPLAHPAPLSDRLRPGSYGDYLLGVSRLDANKRPELLVAAAPLLPAGLRAVVAGTGTMQAQLEARIAADDSAARVRLAGFVADADLIELFAGALAVVYAPVDEDYGYVTLQAFAAAKPVITAADSGAVLEWVTHEETGLVTDGTAAGIAAAAQRLHADPALARRLGENGHARLAGLSWPRVIEALTS